MEKINKQTAVLVLGMHRSGTSALMAGIQNVFGVKLSESKYYLAEDNPKGYFEDFDVVDLNNRLLDYFEASWDSFGSGQKISFSGSCIPSFREEAFQILENKYSDSSFWGLKDPRITILLPFWEDVLRKFGVKPYRIVALRNPLEVALSQKARYENASLALNFRRSGSDLRYVLNLWFWYNLRLLNDLPDDNNVIVSFDALMSDPANEMQRVSRFLKLAPDPAGLNEYKENFLEKQLKHHNVRDIDVEGYKEDYGYVFELHNQMKRHASKGSFSREDAHSILETMPDEKLLTSWASPLYTHCDALRTSSNTLEASNDTLKASNDTLKASNDTLKASNDTLEASNDTLEASNDTLKASNDTLATSCNTLKIRLEHLEEEQIQTYQSLSWRITAPLRKMKALLRKLRGCF